MTKNQLLRRKGVTVVDGEIFVDHVFLNRSQDCIFVFGDNNERCGYGGAAKLRDFKNTYGFITKKKASCRQSDFYTKLQYYRVYAKELRKLIQTIINTPNKTFLISKLGGGIANEFGIFESIIEPSLHEHLKDLPNVVMLWERTNVQTQQHSN